MTKKEEKRRQRRREDSLFTTFLWACIVAILGSAGAVWYIAVNIVNYYTAGA